MKTRKLPIAVYASLLTEFPVSSAHTTASHELDYVLHGQQILLHSIASYQWPKIDVVFVHAECLLAARQAQTAHEST